MTEDDRDPAAIRRTLEAALADCRSASAATADDRRPVALDQATVGRLSRMDALQRQAMAQAAERQRQNRIARLEAALERLEAGEYGYCVACGEAIAAGRLTADPAVPTCIACAGRGRTTQ
jgi:DnaK suppressor protein